MSGRSRKRKDRNGRADNIQGNRQLGLVTPLPGDELMLARANLKKRAPEIAQNEEAGKGILDAMYNNLAFGFGDERSKEEVLRDLMGQSEEGDQAIGAILDYMGSVEQSGATVDTKDLRKKEKKQAKYKKHIKRKAKRNKVLGKILPQGIKDKVNPAFKEGGNKRTARLHEKATDAIQEGDRLTQQRQDLATTGDNEEAYLRARDAMAQLTGWDLDKEEEGKVNMDAFKVEGMLKRFGASKVGKT